MPKSKVKPLPNKPKEAIASTTTMPLVELLARVKNGEDFDTLHHQRMTESDWKIFETMTPEDQGSVENIVGQLRTGMMNPKNALILEKIRADIFRKYE